MKRKSIQSPYFVKIQRSSSYSTSPHFRHEKSSTWGASQSLGPLLFCLQGDKRCTVSTNPQDVSETVLKHFGCCPEFCLHWNGRNNSDEPSLERLERQLHVSVRHLCPNGCYLRAYAPLREWLALYRSVEDETALAGWKCLLLPPVESAPGNHLPRICFESDNGEIFLTKSKVSRYLESSMGSDKAPSSCSQKYLARPHEGTRITDSPLGLIEELFVDNPWKMLLSTIFLNRTSRVQIDTVLLDFLLQWPSAKAVVEERCRHKMVQVLRPLGLCNRRADVIVRFSTDYLQLIERGQDEKKLSRKDVLGIFGCGEYAASAYELFIRKIHECNPQDRALQEYACYQRSRTTYQPTMQKQLW